MEVSHPKERAGLWRLREQTMSPLYPKGSSIRFQNRVKSIEVTSTSEAQGAEKKLGSAAAGAVLGFLIAGPVGTVLGAGAGAGSAKQAKSATFRVTVHFVDQGFLIGEVNESELETLRQNLVPVEKPLATNSSISVADELVKWAGLRDSGVISNEEFAAAKAKLLG